MTLGDQDGRLIARSSRVLEPILGEAVDNVVLVGGAMRLLEIGCGSGVYVRRAAARNPQLTALGLELQPVVAEMAKLCPPTLCTFWRELPSRNEHPHPGVKSRAASANG